jgi:hypothetical protein
MALSVDFEARNPAACRVKDSWNWKSEPCPEFG